MASATSRNRARANTCKTISLTPLIIGHRGASAVAPENTFASFARAFADGAQGIELDVRLARDGVPVVIHDATLRRTGLFGRAVAEMTSKQLAKVDVGSWFNRKHPRLAREEYSHQRVPTLQQVLELSRDHKGLVYVELKSDLAGSTSNLVRSVAKLISALKLHSRVIVVSFNLEALAEIKKLDASIRTGALFAPIRRGKSWRADALISAATNCGADEILLHRLLARRKLIEKSIARNLSVVVWTVDQGRWIQRASALGVCALITNDPAKLLAARREHTRRPP